MPWVICALGAVLSAGGAAAIWSGLSYMPVEWGWSQLIAGTTAVSGGIVTLGLAAVLWRLGTIHRALREGAVVPARPDAAPAPERIPAPERTLTPPPREEEDAVAPIPARLAPAADLRRPGPPPMPDGRQPEPPATFAKPVRAPLEPEPPAHPPSAPDMPVAAAETAPDPSLDLDPGGVEAPAGALPQAFAVEQDRDPAVPVPAKRLSRPLLTGLRARLAGRRDAEAPAPPVAVSLPSPALAPLPWSVPPEPPVSDERPFAGGVDEGVPAAVPDSETAPSEAARPRPVIALVPEPVPAAISVPSAVEAPTVVGRYAAGAASYALFSDGTIEVETESGNHRFESMDDLKRFLEEQDQTSRPGWPAT